METQGIDNKAYKLSMRKQLFHLPTKVNSLRQPLSRHIVCLLQIILFLNLIYIIWFDYLNNISFSRYQRDSLRRTLTTRKKETSEIVELPREFRLQRIEYLCLHLIIEQDIFNNTTTEVPTKRFTEPVSYLILGIKLVDTKLWCPRHNKIVFSWRKELTVDAVFDPCRRVRLFINRIHPFQNSNKKESPANNWKI